MAEWVSFRTFDNAQFKYICSTNISCNNVVERLISTDAKTLEDLHENNINN